MEPELDKVIGTRMNQALAERRAGLLLAVGGVLLLFYVFAAFYLAVRSSVVYLGEATRRMVAGTNETFAVASRDELGEIAGSYNLINSASSRRATCAAASRTRTASCRRPSSTC